MALSQWWSFTESLVEMDHNQAGVYEFADSNGVVTYIGSSNEIKRRLKEHLAEPAFTCIKKNAAKYRIDYTSNYKKREQELYDEFVLGTGRPPKCNDVRPAG